MVLEILLIAVISFLLGRFTASKRASYDHGFADGVDAGFERGLFPATTVFNSLRNALEGYKADLSIERLSDSSEVQYATTVIYRPKEAAKKVET